MERRREEDTVSKYDILLPHQRKIREETMATMAAGSLRRCYNANAIALFDDFTGTSRSTVSILHRAKAIAEELDAQLSTPLIRPPSFEISNDKRVKHLYAKAWPQTGQIRLYRKLLWWPPWELVEETIRHEIAHLYSYQDSGQVGHNAAWQTWAVRCGAVPKAVATVQESIEWIREKVHNG